MLVSNEPLVESTDYCIGNSRDERRSEKNFDISPDLLGELCASRAGRVGGPVQSI